jgi:hypothetical protein
MAYEQLRRMINEPDETTYNDNDLIGYLVENEQDYNAVASVIWYEKAAALQATMYDYGTEGERFTLSQVIDNALRLAKYFAGKQPIIATQMVKYNLEDDDSVTVN